MRTQLLDEWEIEVGILNCLFGVGGELNLEFGGALAQAINDWQIAEWLEPEPRLRASIIVPYEDGELAAAEIDRVGDHPGYVQVMLIARTGAPLGHRKYWKAKWESMSPEEREHFKQEFAQRCKSKWGKPKAE